MHSNQRRARVAGGSAQASPRDWSLLRTPCPLFLLRFGVAPSTRIGGRVWTAGINQFAQQISRELCLGANTAAHRMDRRGCSSHTAAPGPLVARLRLAAVPLAEPHFAQTGTSHHDMDAAQAILHQHHDLAHHHRHRPSLVKRMIHLTCRAILSSPSWASPRPANPPPSTA